MTVWTPQEKEEPLLPTTFLPNDLTSSMDMHHYAWLNQYLGNHEIAKYFVWSPRAKRHYYISDGFWQGRALGNDVQKCITGGERKLVFLGPEGMRDSSMAVVVEDIVSAIKVGREFKTLCLFGSQMPRDWIVACKQDKGVNKLIFWLDSDKFTYSQVMGHIARAAGLSSAAICTRDDPKTYSSPEIRAEVEEVWSLLRQQHTDWPRSKAVIHIPNVTEA